MKPAVLIIDMVRDNLNHEGDPTAVAGRAIVPAVNELTARARGLGFPVIFASDSFLIGDFIFGGKMKPHSIRGTEGAKLYEGLSTRPEDTILPKRRFSAFFKTDLDQTLRLFEVDTVAIGGISTHFCVLATAFDALSLDFKVVLLSDCSAAFRPELHRSILDAFRKNPLRPLFRVMTSKELMAEIEAPSP